MTVKNKILSENGLKRLLPRLKKSGARLVFTNGCFDILHAGHVRLLEKAGSLGDAVIVGLNSDSSVRKLKGVSRPVNKFADRALVLAAVRYVDYVIGFSEETPFRLIREIKPDVLLKGGDYSPEKVVGREFSGKTVIFPLLKGKSTTKIIEKASHK